MGELSSGSADGLGTAATFFNPLGIAMIRGPGMGFKGLYVTDSYNNNIRKISSAGSLFCKNLEYLFKIFLSPMIGFVSVVAGKGYMGSGNADGFGSLAQFSNPRGMAVDQSGDILVADCDNNVIRQLTSSGLPTVFSLFSC